MNLNLISKQMLRDYVDGKILTRKQELWKEVKSTVYAQIGKALNEILGDVSALEKAASKFEDLLTVKIHLLGADSVPEYAKRSAQEANKIYKAHSYFLEEIASKALRALENPREKYYGFQCVPLMDVFNSLQSELQSKIQMAKQGLDKLKSELNNAINIEAKGKQAYNSLVALGVDMSGLPESNPNLPTITKLSVDVCILNGNCNEKSA